MPKLAKDKQLIQSLQRYIANELRNRLTSANNTISSQKAYLFSQVLVNSDENMREQIELVSSEILKFKLPKATFTHLLNNLGKMPILTFIIDELFQEVNPQFLSAQPPCLKHRLSPATIDTICSEIYRFLQTNFGETDLREYATDQRNVRRMDSLARIFTLSSSLSVCSAVTFYEGKLLIAANLERESDRQTVINALNNRYHTLCKFMTTVKDLKSEEILQVAERFYSEMIAEGKSIFQKNVVTQAMCKFAHAVYKDNDTFPKNFRRLFSEFNENNYLVILPALSASNEPQLKISNSLNNSVDYIIEGQPACRSLRLLHAEQLIAWYIFQINADCEETMDLLEENAIKLPLGITKLSCKTCQENLLCLPLEIRGTHKQSYPEVLGLFTHSREPSDPDKQLKPVLTFAKCSNPSTIFDSSSESSNPSTTKVSRSIESFNGNSQRPGRTFSRIKSSRSQLFFSSQPSTLKEKEQHAPVSEPSRRNALASLAESKVTNLESKKLER